MPSYADSGDYTWDNERLSELVSGGGALLDVPARNALRSNGDGYDMRTCNDRHTEEMGRLWAALVHLQRRVEELEAFNTPGK